MEQFVEYVERSLQRLLVYRTLISRLYHLQIPARELVGKQFECSHQCLVQTVLVVVVVYLSVSASYLGVHPLDSLLV